MRRGKVVGVWMGDCSLGEGEEDAWSDLGLGLCADSVALRRI